MLDQWCGKHHASLRTKQSKGFAGVIKLCFSTSAKGASKVYIKEKG